MANLGSGERWRERKMGKENAGEMWENVWFPGAEMDFSIEASKQSLPFLQIYPDTHHWKESPAMLGLCSTVIPVLSPLICKMEALS